jgi:hypothetical protein
MCSDPFPSPFRYLKRAFFEAGTQNNFVLNSHGYCELVNRNLAGHNRNEIHVFSSFCDK